MVTSAQDEMDLSFYGLTQKPMLVCVPLGSAGLIRDLFKHSFKCFLYPRFE